MSDIFQQFSDFIDSQEHRQWPLIGRYQAGDRFCVATYVGDRQYGEVCAIRGQVSAATKAGLLQEMESSLREKVGAL